MTTERESYDYNTQTGQTPTQQEVDDANAREIAFIQTFSDYLTDPNLVDNSVSGSLRQAVFYDGYSLKQWMFEGGMIGSWDNPTPVDWVQVIEYKDNYGNYYWKVYVYDDSGR